MVVLAGDDSHDVPAVELDDDGLAREAVLRRWSEGVEKRAQHSRALGRQNALGVELDALDRKRAVAHSHHLAVGRS